jgi:hypothetical protein
VDAAESFMTIGIRRVRIDSDTEVLVLADLPQPRKDRSGGVAVAAPPQNTDGQIDHGSG